MTSVKEFRVDAAPEGDRPGRGRFVFTDAYSVFDWGPMPDPVERKGASLCTMGASTFEELADAGVKTHYRGVVANGDTARLEAVDGAPTQMAFDLARVPELPQKGREYDYDAYFSAAPTNVLVPLEVVFRNAVPVGSSLRDRVPPRDCGLDRTNWPDEAVRLPTPVVEFSTKLEGNDRYLDTEEADRLAGPASLSELESVARAVNQVVTDRAGTAGLTHQDGKIECVHVDGEVRVADVAGTLDENRFARRGRQLSKELLRQYHRRYQSEWVAAVADAKATAKRRDVADWRNRCERRPDSLPQAVLDAMSNLYAAATNAYVGRERLDATTLDDAVDAVDAVFDP